MRKDPSVPFDATQDRRLGAGKGRVLEVRCWDDRDMKMGDRRWMMELDYLYYWAGVL